MTRLQARTIFVAVLVAAIPGAFRPQSGRLQFAKSVLQVPLTTVQRGIAGLTGGLFGTFQNDPDATALRQRNAELEAQIAQLQKQVVDLQENQAELKLLSALLDFARSEPENRHWRQCHRPRQLPISKLHLYRPWVRYRGCARHAGDH